MLVKTLHPASILGLRKAIDIKLSYLSRHMVIQIRRVAQLARIGNFFVTSHSQKPGGCVWCAGFQRYEAAGAKGCAKRDMDVFSASLTNDLSPHLNGVYL